eukprot:scaffold289055_cov41-Tisochrysis_lutea.AAC.3
MKQQNSDVPPTSKSHLVCCCGRHRQRQRARKMWRASGHSTHYTRALCSYVHGHVRSRSVEYGTESS